MSLRILALIGALTLLCSGAAQADGLAIKTDDTVQTVLTAHKGARVTVRLSSGQELTGVLRDTTAKLAVVGALSGREFFDAVVPLEHIEAVIVRTRK